MDNSQSSDVFSDTSISCNSLTEIMDVRGYDTLLNKTKASLCNTAQIGKVSFPIHFSTALDDCRQCITQSLDLAVNILLEDNIQLSKLVQCMDDTVSLLQLLSTLIKNVVESISMACCSFKTFPTTAGHIILLVFTHCKNSESVYGAHLTNVQKQLKDLFRTCHELQLTYLMVLEKHIIFDLTEDEQLDILIEALNINLKIGEVVQALDVKTMAEQWKAYMALCDKYSCHLMDKQIYQECMQLLCTMIDNNLRNASEVDQDEKVIVRSLKITNFTIKILLKICIIFKHSTMCNYTEIVDLLIYVYLKNPSYLECIQRKPSHFVNAIISNICTPADLLLGELITDDKFMNVVLTYSINKLQDDKLLGYVFLIVGIAKYTLQRNGETPTYPKHKLLICIFKVLPKCHAWLNIGMKFKNELSESNQSIGLFEYMLIHGIGLAATSSMEEMCQVEKLMYEAILGTRSVTALFSSNLWTALARMSNNRQLLFSQVMSLCQIYQKLEKHKAFLYSPQRVHISYTIEGLFRAMRPEDRVRVFKQIPPTDRRNGSLWSMLQIKNLPKELQRNVQEDIMDRYRTLQSCAPTEGTISDLIQDMKLLSSCSFFTIDDVENCLVHAWLRVCPEKYKNIVSVLDSGTLWYYEYVEALASWTCAVENAFRDRSANLIKVLHVISNMIKIGTTELNLSLINLLCNLATIPVHCENKHTVDSLLKESLKSLVQGSDDILVRNKLFTVIRTCDNKRLEQIMYSSNSEECQEAWNSFKRKSNVYNITKLKEILLRTADYKYVHKCIERRKESVNLELVDEVHRTASSNFDFADLDTLFDNGSDSEPASKRIKTDSSEAERILQRLETDTALLCNLKENMFHCEHRRRIQGVCDKLKSFIT